MVTKKLKICAECLQPKLIWKSYQGKKYCKDCWYKSGIIIPKHPTKQFPISRVSEKRSKEERIYAAQRIIFLAEHPMCEFHIVGICTQVATEVHHKEGRTGENYLDKTKWLAGCHECHQWATNHPEEAIQLGFSLKRIN